MNQSISNRIFKGTLIVVSVGIIAKLTAFLAEAVLAAYLGTTYQSDAYYMITSVHAVIYPMMSVGIWQVFLPLYKGHITKSENDAAHSITDKTLSFFFLISLGVVVLLLVFAPIVVSVVAPGFKGDTKELCIKLVRLSSPMYFFIVASAVYASVLQCHNKFLGSQIREVASHIPIILAAVLFYKNSGIEALAIALVFAGVLRLLVELPFVNWGYRYKPDLNLKGEEFALMLRRLPSALVSAGVAQLNTLIDKAMASMLPTGTVSCLNYGNKLMNVFSGLVSSAIATATYPQIIELIALDQKEELGKMLTKIINTFSVLMFPITLACILFREELVSAVFERGAFNSQSTALTASVFALYCLGLFFVAVNMVMSNVFYGHGDTKTPMYISMANLAVNVVLNIVLISIWGVNGLALATSLSAIISFFLRMRAARKYVHMNHLGMLITTGKVLVASTVACSVPRIVFWIQPVNKYLLLVSSTLIGVGVYYLLVKLLKVPEVDELLSLINKKIKEHRLMASSP